jgi:hypothetical protein
MENYGGTSTQHQILPGNVFDRLSGGISAADWLMDAVNAQNSFYTTGIMTFPDFCGMVGTIKGKPGQEVPGKEKR